jgi:hypothetical protein
MRAPPASPLVWPDEERSMEDTQRGVMPVRDISTLQVLLSACGYDVVADGYTGPGTTAAVRKFQQDNGLIVDGSAGEKTWLKLFALQPALVARMAEKALSQADIESFADKHDLTIPLVRTVYFVEAKGSGFIGDRPKILFEGHQFWSQLKALNLNPMDYLPDHKDIVFERYDPKSYSGGVAEFARLERARKISDTAALSAASWGMFQVMGSNAKWLGYPDVQTFVAAMNKSEAEHLESFGRFITAKKMNGRPLIDYLRNQQWATFAEGYNGASYKQNKYDEKLAQAYAQLSAA